LTFKLSPRSLKALQGVHPDLVRVVQATIEISTVDFVVTEGLRTRERQTELVAAGASQTMASRHLVGADGFGHAVDLAAWVGEVRWDMGLYYQIATAVQRASRSMSVPVRWGGAWVRLDTATLTPAQCVADYVARCKASRRKAFIDGPHFELPAGEYP
jgi:peptidoglycan L-alanyl-D-glutamate endopeptidase CwlK